MSDESFRTLVGPDDFKEKPVLEHTGEDAPAKQRRMSVLSIKSEVSVDDASSDSDSDTYVGSTGTPDLLLPRPRTPKPSYTEAIGDFRLAWLRVEGWRAQLRKSGDIVERHRWEWRAEDRPGLHNKLPVIVAKVPGVSVLKGGEFRVKRRRQKSVHWA